MKPAEMHTGVKAAAVIFFGNTHAKMRSIDIKRNCISEECKVARKRWM